MAQTMKDILNRMLNHEELSREEMKNILIGITQSEYYRADHSPADGPPNARGDG